MPAQTGVKSLLIAQPSLGRHGVLLLFKLQQEKNLLGFHTLTCYNLQGTLGHGEGVDHPVGASRDCTKINVLKTCPLQPQMQFFGESKKAAVLHYPLLQVI